MACLLYSREQSGTCLVAQAAETAAHPGEGLVVAPEEDCRKGFGARFGWKCSKFGSVCAQLPAHML